jgi:DNA-binding NtrC family response regulator
MGNLQPPMLSIAVTLLDRNRESCERIRIALLGLGFRVSVVHSEAQAIEAAGTSVLIISGGPPEWQVYATRQVLSEKPLAVVIVLAGEGDPRTAVEVMKAGAIDYLTQPYSMEQLRRTLIHAAERVNSAAALEEIRRSFAMKAQMRLEGMVAHSPAMEKLFRIIPKVANSDHPALILGESGTGKELVASAIHRLGPRRSHPFVAVDCGSLVPTLIESELFGHVKGAFTGASRSKDGLLSSANGGTVFLDEIGELPLEMQAKLLRALQEKEVRPVGSTRSVPFQARILAATNRELDAAVQQGLFRRDLFYRINVVTLRIPPLRERKEDIALLAKHFLHLADSPRGIERDFTDDALRLLLSYEWPGNVRELENTINRAAAFNTDQNIEPLDLPSPLLVQRDVEQSLTVSEGMLPIAEMEKRAILATLTRLGGDKLKTARALGIGKTTLYRKLKEYGADA